jgi:opacity protein-like surface antigen
MRSERFLVRSTMIAFAVAGSLTTVCGDACGETNGQGKMRWATLRVQGIVTLPLGENHVKAWNDCSSEGFDYLDFRSAIDVNTCGGILANFEYVMRGRYGLEVDLIYWRRIVGLSFAASGLTVDGSPNFILPTFGLNYHFLIDERKDMYAGALCSLGVIATGFFSDIEISKDVALGLNVGMDYFIRESWSLGGSLKYIDFGEMDFSVLPSGWKGFICDNGLFGIGHMNVVSLTFGVGYRF